MLAFSFTSVKTQPACRLISLTEGVAGLLQGLPDGSEEEKLWSFEEDMERNSVLLRQYKSQNEQVGSAVPESSACL